MAGGKGSLLGGKGKGSLLKGKGSLLEIRSTEERGRFRKGGKGSLLEIRSLPLRKRAEMLRERLHRQAGGVFCKRTPLAPDDVAAVVLRGAGGGLCRAGGCGRGRREVARRRGGDHRQDRQHRTLHRPKTLCPTHAIPSLRFDFVLRIAGGCGGRFAEMAPGRREQAKWWRKRKSRRRNSLTAIRAALEWFLAEGGK